MFARRFFTDQEQQMIVEAIKAAELKTSGEIRVHLESFCLGDPLKRAEKIFAKLGMHRTAERNGVLIYIALRSRKLAVAGDAGIHARLSSEYWTKIVENLVTGFKQERKAEALAACILECGQQLARYFPRKSDDKNELDNSISFRS
ncbi:MAG TPA: TPM domain-containing protein [Bacteroidia bacterium]|nr:TPM domain-containing protein [Bacteroidia bacterium]